MPPNCWPRVCVRGSSHSFPVFIKVWALGGHPKVLLIGNHAIVEPGGKVSVQSDAARPPAYCYIDQNCPSLSTESTLSSDNWQVGRNCIGN